MADLVDAATRSRMMASIRGRDTRPELALRSALHRLGLRFRLHRAGLPGRPDIVLPRHRAVVFVHGCFWHRHPGCRLAYDPRSREEFWQAKFAGTVERDARQRAALLDDDWRVATVWECALRERGAAEVAAELASWLKRAEAEREIGVPLPPLGQARGQARERIRIDDPERGRPSPGGDESGGMRWG